MTATPIPRTLAMTAYGDLDVSAIHERPPGRTPVRTTVRPEERRAEVYEFVHTELEQGRQIYVVYPLVEDSQKIDVRAATQMADHLAAEVFPAHRVALLHGRMKPDAKERTMAAFLSGEIQVLVSTTVIEVGVDVANATVMLVEHAERFGLAQLHQLRGRVGRGTAVSSCILMYQAPLTEDARARLKAIAATDDGFALAEKDLELRGPGDVFGTRQSGMPHLRVGDLLRDRDTMELARTKRARGSRPTGKRTRPWRTWPARGRRASDWERWGSQSPDLPGRARVREGPWCPPRRPRGRAAGDRLVGCERRCASLPESTKADA